MREILFDKDYGTLVKMIKYYYEVMQYMYTHYNSELNEVITSIYTYNIFISLEEKGLDWVIEKIKNEADLDREAPRESDNDKSCLKP